MSKTTQDLLKKINYIDADIEIHKQILFSIPSDNKKEIESTLKVIAGKKEAVAQLRNEIKEIDPEEHNWIVVFEKAIDDFKKIATEKKFQSIVSKNINEDCSLAMVDSSEVECLIKACDENGDWTIITLTGEVKHFEKDTVAEKPEQQPLTN